MDYLKNNLEALYQSTCPTLPAKCLLPAYCGSKECEFKIAKCHEIGVDVFAQIVAPSTGGKFYPASWILDEIGNADCSTHTVLLDENVPSNDQIEFRVVETGGLLINYSISLFRGIFQSEPLAFFFHLAVKNGREDVVFSVVFSQEMKYYDLSNEQPLQGGDTDAGRIRSLQVSGDRPDAPDCTDPAYQQWLASKHAFKSRTEFDLAVKAYNDVYRQGKSARSADLTWADLLRHMGTHHCSKFRIKLKVSEVDPQKTDITFVADEIKALFAFETFYHFPVLHGAQQRHAGEAFHFHLAIDNKNEKSVAFEVVDGSGKAVGWYDLSNEQP